MKVTRSGIILFTEHYRQCVSFYSEQLQLPVLFALDNEHSQLTCCDLGQGNYLMIETGGTAVDGGKPVEQNPVWLRFNVEDVEQTARDLSARGVAVTLRKEPWGTLADFTDPDGNRCSLRDEGSFGQ